VNPDKVASLNAGRSPIVEKGLEELIATAAANGTLRATTSTAEAVNATDLSLLCVGTPSRKNGSLDLSYLERVCEQIGEALKDKDTYHVVVVRSTVLPGTTHDLVIPTLEKTSGKKYGTGFGVTVNPEFLREGTAIHDFRNPPLTLVGHNFQSDAAPTEALYAKVDAPMINTSIRTAEMMKYASNTWHALKVCFANEIGNLCKRFGVDSHDVMDIFCRDEKLNLSSYYLKPGFAFGGSCLPKDVRALQYRAKEVDVDLPVIAHILPSNRMQIQLALDQVLETGKKKIGLLGFSFKAGTDDLRESPRPRLGYVGTVGPWLDVSLLTHLARRRPHWSITLIGPVERGLSQLPELDNLRILGERPYASLPQYLAAMDVLLIPLRVSELTHAVNPIKLYEYCATGKPIVATRIAELEGDRHLFHLGDGPEGFLRAVDAALAETVGPDRALATARQDLARASSWDRRVADLEDLLAQLP
jgi:nucleotide sugar dehydrogenase